MTRTALSESHLRLKRAYEPAVRDDGVRILIDRLWPRGVSKEEGLLSMNEKKTSLHALGCSNSAAISPLAGVSSSAATALSFDNTRKK